MAPRRKNILNKTKTLKKECDKLWADCIKVRANYKSEFSGKTERLHAHHILGKSSYNLRYSLENGICITAGEHFFFAHHQGRKMAFEDRLKTLRGHDIFEKLDSLKWGKIVPDLTMIKVYLIHELTKLKEEVE